MTSTITSIVTLVTGGHVHVRSGEYQDSTPFAMVSLGDAAVSVDLYATDPAEWDRIAAAATQAAAEIRDLQHAHQVGAA